MPLFTIVNAVVQFSSAARCAIEPMKPRPGIAPACSTTNGNIRNRHRGGLIRSPIRQHLIADHSIPGARPPACNENPVGNIEHSPGTTRGGRDADGAVSSPRTKRLPSRAHRSSYTPKKELEVAPTAPPNVIVSVLELAVPAAVSVSASELTAANEFCAVTVADGSRRRHVWTTQHQRTRPVS